MHPAGSDKPAGQVVIPLMIGADQRLDRSLLGQADFRPPMPACIKKCPDRTCSIPNDKNWSLADRQREVIAGNGNFTLGTCENPPLVEDRFQII